MMIRRKGAPDDRAGRGEVNGELICDSRVLEVGDTLRREQKREDVAILAGFARGKRGKRPDRQAEIETNAVDVASADAGAGARRAGRRFRSSSTSGRIASGPRSMMDRPPTFTTCSQGRSRIGRLSATGRVSSPSRRVWRASGEATCLISLVVSAIAVTLSGRGDDGADGLAGECAG